MDIKGNIIYCGECGFMVLQRDNEFVTGYIYLTEAFKNKSVRYTTWLLLSNGDVVVQTDKHEMSIFCKIH